MISHLKGREKALEPFGWTGRRAKWIVLACLSRSIAGRRIGSSGPCSSEGLTAEDMLERRKVCRIFRHGRADS